MSILHHLTALESSGLIRLAQAEPDLEYLFRHAMVQDAAYESLLKADRRWLHLVVGETLESEFPDRLEALAPRLASHFYEAGDDRALKYFTLAGQAAARHFANAEAVHYYTQAIHAARRAGRSAAELHRARGRVHEALGNFEAARADHEAALGIARAEADRRAEWRALLDLGMLWASRDYARTGDLFRQALDLAREIGDPVAVARSLNRVGNWHLNVEQPLDALRHHREALAILQESGNRRAIAETLDLLGMTSYLGGDLVRGTEYYRQALELFREMDDRPGLISALAGLAMRGTTYQTDTMIPAAPSLDEPIRDGEEALRIARETGWRSAEAYTLMLLGFVLGPRGEYARALRGTEAALRIAEEIEHRQWACGSRCVLGALHLDLFALPAARQYLEAAHAEAKQIGSWHWMRTSAGFLASTLVLQGEPGTAEALLDSVLDPGAPAQTLGQRLAWCARGELALARGDPAQALRAVDELIACAPQPEATVMLRVWKLKGEALAALGRTRDAEATLAEAAAYAESQAARPMLWRMRVTLGGLYRARSRPDDAEREFAAARSIVDELAAGIPDPALREDFLASVSRLISSLQFPTSSVRP